MRVAIASLIATATATATATANDCQTSVIEDVDLDEASGARL